jgi:hypothetical protein
MQMESTYWLEKVLEMISLYVNALLCKLSYTRCNSAGIDTADLHRVYDNMPQGAQKCIDVQADHFQHLL